jgi:hypothetical protein
MSTTLEDSVAAIAALPGLKRREITNCVLCGKGLAHDRNIAFYRVRVEQYVFDHSSITRRHGLELFFGGGSPGAVLAQAMGADEDLAKQFSDSSPQLICQPCALESPAALPRILEAATEAAEKRAQVAREAGPKCTHGNPEGWCDLCEADATAARIA